MKRFFAAGALILVALLSGCSSAPTSEEVCAEAVPLIEEVMAAHDGVSTGDSIADLAGYDEEARGALSKLEGVDGGPIQAGIDEYTAATRSWLDAGEKVRGGAADSSEMVETQERTLAALGELYTFCTTGE